MLLPPVPVPPPSPPKPELTPGAVAETELAATVFLVVEPWTTTVSPGRSPPADALALRVTVVDFVSVTFTSEPAEVRTYRLSPSTTETVPVAAAVDPGKPAKGAPEDPVAPADAVPGLKRAAKLASEFVAPLEWFFSSSAPPQNPAAISTTATSAAAGIPSRIPCVERVTHSSSVSPLSETAGGGDAGPPRLALVCSAVGSSDQLSPSSCVRALELCGVWECSLNVSPATRSEARRSGAGTRRGWQDKGQRRHRRRLRSRRRAGSSIRRGLA